MKKHNLFLIAFILSIVALPSVLAVTNPCNTIYTDAILCDNFDDYVVSGADASTINDGDSCDLGGWSGSENGCIYNQTGVINGTGSLYLDETMNDGGAFTMTFPDVITEGVNDSTVCITINTINAARLYFELNDGTGQCLMGYHVSVPNNWVVTGSVADTGIPYAGTHLLCMIIGEADNTCTYWINGNKIHNQNTTMANGGVSDLKFSLESDHKFIMDDFVITTYHNGTMPEYIGAPVPPVTDTGILDLIFRNLSTDTKTVFQEGENLVAYVNYSYSVNYTSIPDGSCNTTIFNATAEQEGEDDNFTLYPGGDFSPYSQEFNLSNATSIDDFPHFKVCHLNTMVSDLNVIFSCDAGIHTEIIDKTEFVACTNGHTKIFVFNTTCSTNDIVTINFSNNAIGINQGHRIADFDFDREYASITTELTYNATLGLYHDSDIEFYKHGTETVWGNCTGIHSSINKTTIETLTIVNRAPKITFNNINISGNIYNLTNNTIYEFGFGDITFSVSIEDDDLLEVNYTFGNATGVVQHGSNNTIHSIVFRSFIGNPFNITVSASDTAGNITRSWLFYNFTDTSAPAVFGLNNDSIANNSGYEWDFSIIDSSVFSVYVSCDNGFSDNRTGLNSQNYSYSNSTLITSNTTCDWHICDGHTALELSKSWRVEKNLKTASFITTYSTHELEYIGDYDYMLSHTLEKDRISWQMNFGNTPKGWKQYQFIYRPPAQSYYFPSDKYPAWIVDTSETWFDLDCDVDDIFVQKINGEYRITMETDKDTLECSSIGELNCFDFTTTIELTVGVVYDDTQLQMRTCPTTTAGMLSLIFAFAMLLTIAIVNWKYMRIPFLTIMVGFGYIAFAYVYFGCQSTYFWTIPLVFGLGLIFKGFFE